MHSERNTEYLAGESVGCRLDRIKDLDYATGALFSLVKTSDVAAAVGLKVSSRVVCLVHRLCATLSTMRDDPSMAVTLGSRANNE